MMAPSPKDNGWNLVDNELAIVWMLQDPAPDSILESVSCGCKTSKCNSSRCSCSKAKVSCTDLCKCIVTKCENRQQTEETHEHQDIESTISDSDSDMDL